MSAFFIKPVPGVLQIAPCPLKTDTGEQLLPCNSSTCTCKIAYGTIRQVVPTTAIHCPADACRINSEGC